MTMAAAVHSPAPNSQAPAYIGNPAAQTRSWSDYLPSAATIQHGFMILIVATSILSAMPAYRMIGTLGLRCTSLASASFTAFNSSANEHWIARIAKCTKVGSIALGIAGFYTAIPVFTLAPLVLEPLLQALLLIGRGFNGDGIQRVFSFISFLTNLLGCIGLVTSSFGWMMAACVIHIILMLYSGICVTVDASQRPNSWSWIDWIREISYGLINFVSHMVLAALNMVTYCTVMDNIHPQPANLLEAANTFTAISLRSDIVNFSANGRKRVMPQIA